MYSINTISSVYIILTRRRFLEMRQFSQRRNNNDKNGLKLRNRKLRQFIEYFVTLKVNIVIDNLILKLGSYFTKKFKN